MFDVRPISHRDENYNWLQSWMYLHDSIGSKCGITKINKTMDDHIQFHSPLFEELGQKCFQKKKNVLIQSCVLLCFRIVIYNLEQLYNLHNHYMSNILLGLLVMQSKSNYALFLILFVDI